MPEPASNDRRPSPLRWKLPTTPPDGRGGGETEIVPPVLWSHASFRSNGRSYRFLLTKSSRFRMDTGAAQADDGASPRPRC